MIRRYFFWCSLLGVTVILSACSWLDSGTMRSQSPEDDAEESTTRLIGDIVAPFGLYPVRIEAVGLVTGLDGTGSDPAPSELRQHLVDEMQIRGVENPNTILASRNCALVLVQATLRPGIQKGDRFDVEVRVPSQSETTSLRGGYLLETRLGELGAMEDGYIHTGRIYGQAEGPVLVSPSADAQQDRIQACQGRILGGGIATQSRKLALVLSPGNQTVFNASRVANAVNRRFHVYRNGLQVGMAKAINNELIELKILPRYKDNVARYVEVIRALAISETSPQRMQRITALKGMLRNPDTAPRASLQLEAIGPDGIPPLLEVLDSKDPEVRLYAAEALAYLDRSEAARPLGELAVQYPAFRVYALTALSAMQDYLAMEQLHEMLSSSSAETRYGAFRALTVMSLQDPITADQNIGRDFRYHVLDVAGPPLIHVTTSRQAEIVLFGKNQEFLTPLAIDAGTKIMVTSVSPNQISVSRFAVGQADQKRLVSTKVDEVIRAIVELGGTYPDVVQTLQEAKAQGGLSGRFAVDALPKAGRTYQRTIASEEGVMPVSAVETTLSEPAPDLFTKERQHTSPQEDGKKAEKTVEEAPNSPKTSAKKRNRENFFSKIRSLGSKKSAEPQKVNAE
ncbi:MAG: flagellar basal body P-ring protein FlgI [Pirellulales bacterium]|nr:flagellar basal body P-ring protein FlgI [Pirellulales bacterium]